MFADRAITALEEFGELIPNFVGGISDEDAQWKPPSQNWSILEIVCHLIDEERDDFRKRIELTLENPLVEWPSINPELWAIDRQYIVRDFQESIASFQRERTVSIAWLRNLDDPNWNQFYDHPHLGQIRAGDLLVSWVAHDQLHVRQITKRRYEMVNRDSSGFSSSYAGGWD